MLVKFHGRSFFLKTYRWAPFNFSNFDHFSFKLLDWGKNKNCDGVTLNLDYFLNFHKPLSFRKWFANDLFMFQTPAEGIFVLSLTVVK